MFDFETIPVNTMGSFELASDAGRCPLCGIKMNWGNQRSCLKIPKEDRMAFGRNKGQRPSKETA